MTWFTRGNKKLGPNVFTWSRPFRQTCPDSCMLLATGTCYADPEFRWLGIRMMNEGAIKRYGQIPPLDQLGASALVRLHVVGDFGVGNAPDETYIAGLLKMLDSGRLDRPTVWTYTHGWRQWRRELDVLRPYIHILASCDTHADVRDALKAKWRIAYHGPEINLEDTYHYVGQNRLLICPEQTGKAESCEKCRACWSPSKRFTGIAFKDH